MLVNRVNASPNLHMGSLYATLGSFRQARTCVKDPIVTPAGDSLIGAPRGVFFIQTALRQTDRLDTYEEKVGGREDVDQGQIMDTQYETPPKAETISEMTVLRHQESDLCI